MSVENHLSLRDIESIFKASSLVEMEQIKALKTSILSLDKLNSKDENGNTVLIYVCSNNFTNFLKFILTECIVDIDIKNRNDETALFGSARTENFESIKLLIDAGANTTIVNIYGLTFLNYLNKEHYDKVIDLLSCNIKPAKRY